MLASGTFAEADGTLVNNEGRAQRFLQVQASDVEVQESWRWLLQAAKALDHEKLSGLNDFDSIIKSIESDLPQFARSVQYRAHRGSPYPRTTDQSRTPSLQRKNRHVRQS